MPFSKANFSRRHKSSHQRARSVSCILPFLHPCLSHSFSCFLRLSFQEEICAAAGGLGSGLEDTKGTASCECFKSVEFRQRREEKEGGQVNSQIHLLKHLNLLPFIISHHVQSRISHFQLWITRSADVDLTRNAWTGFWSCGARRLCEGC